MIGFEGTGIDSKKRIHVPSVVYGPIKEKWNTREFYAGKSTLAQTDEEGKLRFRDVLSLYPYNPCHPTFDSLSYTRYKIKKAPREIRRITLSDEHLEHLGARRGSVVVWSNMVEYVELWEFGTWRDYNEICIRKGTDSDDNKQREFELFVGSIMRSKHIA